MTDMLRVPALQICHPVQLIVLMKVYDPSLDALQEVLLFVAGDGVLPVCGAERYVVFLRRNPNTEAISLPQ